MKSNSRFLNCFATVGKVCFPVIVLFIFILSLSGCKKNSVLVTAAPVKDSTEFNYSVHFSYKDPAIVGGHVGQLYTDSADFDLNIKIEPEAGTGPQKIAVASISNIQNYAPSVVPLKGTYPVSEGVQETWTWIPDAVGMYDIDSTEVLNPFLSGDWQIELNFINNQGLSPSFSAVREPGGNKVIFPSAVLNRGQVVTTPGFLKLTPTMQEIGSPATGFYFRFIPIL